MARNMEAVRTAPGLARRPIPVIIGLSAAVTGFLVWLIYFKGTVSAPAWTADLPLANAIFNSCCAACLICGYIAIRRRKDLIHMRCMIAATVFSALFLTSYITYHYFRGDVKFPGHGWIRPVYFFILITHILTSMIALPLIFATLWYALGSQFRFHRAVSRWTFPVWLYVSVTGVIVYAVLRSYT